MNIVLIAKEQKREKKKERIQEERSEVKNVFYFHISMILIGNHHRILHSFLRFKEFK